MEVTQFGLDLRLELGALVQNWLDLYLAKSKPSDLSQCLDKEFTLVAKYILIAANDGPWLQLDMLVLLLVLSETDAVVACHHKDLLVDFLIFKVDDLLCFIRARLKVFEKLNHEGLVDVVLPLIC